MKLTYTTIKLPTALILFFLGMVGFLGYASFFGSIFDNEIIGYGAGCVGFVITLFSYYQLGKMNYKHKQELEKFN